MPSSRVGLPSDWWVPSIRRGIIRESALWPLCRRRHNGHWTGHETRLNRGMLNKFGSQDYAREELRAEIASMIMGADLGLAYDPNQHAAYTAHWVAILQNDSLEIFRAAADAEKIHKHLLSLQHQQSVSDETSDDDKNAIIKEYDRLVDGPEARKRFEEQRPSLVTARDKAITELRRDKANRELGQKQKSQHWRAAHR